MTGMGYLGHGETCNRCGGENVIWAAPSPLWNLVMRGNDVNGEPRYGDLVCIRCFIVLADKAGVKPNRWRVYADPEPEGLVKVTPSGRVWDAERWLWVEPETSTADDVLPELASTLARHLDTCYSDRSAADRGLLSAAAYLCAQRIIAGGWVDPAEVLTQDEQAAIRQAGDLWNTLCRVVGRGSTRDHDLAELVHHVHAIQHTVMSQAAARARPDQYRLLGEALMARLAGGDQS